MFKRFAQCWILISAIIVSQSLYATQYVAGDLAPLGSPDGELNAADLTVLSQMVFGLTTPTAIEQVVGDVGPLNSPDGFLNAGDLLILQRAILGEITLSPITIGPEPPVLDSVATPVYSDLLTVTGSATNGTDVRIYLNSSLVTTVVASVADGSFSANLTLPLGANSIHATEWDGATESVISNVLNVDYLLPTPTLNALPTNTSSNGITVTGTVAADALIKLYVDGIEFGQVSSSSGSFQFDNVILSIGSNSIYAVTTNGVQDSAASNTEIVNYNFTTPVIADSGNSGNANPYSINGNADPTTEMRIYLNGDYQQSVTTDALGAFSIDVYLTHGSNSITARAWDGYVETADSNIVSASYTDSTSRDLNQTGIGSDTVWTPGASNTPYVITRYFIVSSGATLTIMPGTQVEYNATTENIGLQVQGTLKVLGSAASPVVFTSAEAVKASGDWPGLLFTGSSVNSEIHFAKFEYARNAVWALSNGEVNVYDSIFENYSNAGVYTNSNSSGIVADNLFDNIDQLPTSTASITTVGSGVQLRDSNFTVSGNEFTRTNLGIYQVGGTSIVSGNNFHNMRNGIWLSNSGVSTINQGNIWTDLDIGIYMTGDTVNTTHPQPVINNNNFYNNNVLNILADDFVNGASDLIDATQNWWGGTDPRVIITTIADSQGGTFYILDNPPTINYGSYLSALNGQPVYDNWLFTDINVNTTLNAGERYEVFKDITIGSAATLTVPAGTELHFVNNDLLTVDGDLDIQGSLSQPVVVTSNANSPGAGSWQGMRATSAGSSITMDYAQVSFASTAVDMQNGIADITNSTFDENNFGIQFSAGVTGNIEANNFTNGNTAIRLIAASPSVRTNTIQGHIYGIYLSNGASPIIDLANVITANNYGVYALGDGSTLANNPLPTLSNNSLTGNTSYNYFANNFFTPENVILNAKDNWWGVNDAVSVALTIHDTNSSASAPLVDYGRYLDQENGTPVVANSLIGNVTSNLDVLQDEVYEIIGDVTIAAGVTLNVADGAQFIFTNNAEIVVNGTLNVSGISGNLATFTSITPSSGSWKGIRVESGGVINLDYAKIQYAARAVDLQFATGAITNSEISDSDYGIYISDSSPSISTNIIQNNTFGLYIYGLSDPVINNANSITANQFGVYALGSSIIVDQNPNPVITGNDIQQNTAANYFADNFYNAATTMLVATDNYWGDTDPLVISQTISDRMDGATNSPFVDFGHYLDAIGGSIVKQNYLLGSVSGVVSDVTETYEVLSDLFVAQGQTLQILQGVQLEFLADYQLVVNGTLDIQGSLASNVLFTTGESVKNISDWKGILLTDTSINSVINYANIEYAERGIEFNGSSGTVTNTQLHNNNSAVYVTGANANPVINTNNIITNNTYGVYVLGEGTVGTNPNPSVTGNSIHSNTNMNYYSSNFYQADLTVLNATSNWWNLLTASQVAAKIVDHNDVVTAPHINYGQYLDSENGIPVSANSLVGPINGTINTSSGNTYEVLGDIQIVSGDTLTIDAGVNLVFVDNATLTVNGNLNIQGTELNPVNLTSVTATTGAWGGMEITSAATTVNIDWANVEYANYGIYFNESGAVGTVTNTTIENNTRGIYAFGNSSPVIGGNNSIRSNQYGIYLQGLNTTGNSPLPTINGNEISSNSSYNVYTLSYFEGDNPVVDAMSNFWGETDINLIANKIYDIANSTSNRPIVNFSGFLDMPGGQSDPRQFLLIGEITQNTTISADTNYIVPYSLNVAAGITLTIEQGAELYFLNNKGITVNGTLVVNGVSGNEVIFTSATRFLNSNTYDWTGIRVEGATGSVTIQNAIISHATNGIYFNNASGSVSNSVFIENQYGIYLTGSSNPIIDSNTFVDNYTGIYLNGSSIDPLPNITNNDIYGNNINLYLNAIDTTTVLNIANNWWGTNVIADIRNTIQVVNGSDQSLSVLLDTVASVANQLAIPTGVVVSEQYISPAQSVGVQDSVNLTATFSQSSSWSVDVKNTAGVSVRTYSGTGTALNVTWDGQDAVAQDVADGAYIFAISVSGSEVRHVRSVVIDNALPVASFIAGLDGTTINASTLAISGSATDNYFANYVVEYGVGNTPAIWTVIDSLKTSQVSSGNLVDWLLTNTSGLTPPQNGNNAIRLSVTDLAGNSSTQQIQVTLDFLAIYDVSHDVTTIKPVLSEVSTISFTINNPATVTLQIAAELDGTVIRSIVQNFATSGTFSMIWDGKDDGTNYVVDEAYTYTLTADDGSRQASYAPSFNSSVGSVGGSSLIGYSVSKNKFWKSNVSVGSTYGGRVRLCIGSTTSPPSSGCNGTNHFAAVDEVPYENGSNWLYWDGRDPNGNAIKSKDYRFFLSVPATLPPNTIIVKGNTPFIQGEGSVAPNIEVKSNPYKVRHSYDESSSVKYQIDQDSNVTIKLLPPGINDPSDPSAIVLVNNELQTAEVSPGVPQVYNFEWLGYDDSVPVPDTNNILVDQNGRYTYTIQATSVVTGSSSLYRGSLRLYH